MRAVELDGSAIGPAITLLRQSVKPSADPVTLGSPGSTASPYESRAIPGTSVESATCTHASSPERISWPLSHTPLICTWPTGSASPSGPSATGGATISMFPRSVTHALFHSGAPSSAIAADAISSELSAGI